MAESSNDAASKSTPSVTTTTTTATVSSPAAASSTTISACLSRTSCPSPSEPESFSTVKTSEGVVERLKCSGEGTHHYEEISLIGSGAYGHVYKARDRKGSPHEIVALKKVRIPLSPDGVPVSLIREISVLRTLESFNHANIVKLLDVCQGEINERDQCFYLYLIFEHLDKDLSVLLQEIPPPGLSPDRIREIMYLILKGVDFLHSNRIVHRDLKPQNVLVASSGQIKIADFGLARIYDQTQALTSVVVTLWYRAPEVLLSNSYASSLDLWSCGCIFAELFLRRPLFKGTSEIDQLNSIFRVIGSPKEQDWPKESIIPYHVIRTSVVAAGDVSVATEADAPASSSSSNISSSQMSLGSKRSGTTTSSSCTSSSVSAILSTLIPQLCSHANSLMQQMLDFNPQTRITARDALQHDYFREYITYPSSHASQPEIPFPRIKRRRITQEVKPEEEDES